MAYPDATEHLHHDKEQPRNTIKNLNESLGKNLFERLKEDKEIPRADIIKELKEHDIVSYLYKDDPTDIDLAGVQTNIDELGFIHDNKQNKMIRGKVYYYLTFKKEGDGAHVCLNEVRRCSVPGLAHIKALKIDEFAEFVHKNN